MADPLITDKNVYPEPTPLKLPAANNTFTDPTFGTTLLRVTDEADGTTNTNSYSSWPSLNCNNTRLLYMSDGRAMVCDFNAETMRVSNKRALFQKPISGSQFPWAEDAIWSGLNPDSIFCHWAMVIYAYNLVANTYTVIADLTGKAGNGANLQQMAKSLDDAAFGFNLQDAAWNRIGFLAYRKRQTGDDLYVRMTNPDDPTTAIDEVQIDKTGRYLMQLTGLQGKTAVEARVIDLDTRSVTNITDAGPDYCPSHRDVGKDFVVGADNWNNTLTARKLSAPHQYQVILNLGNDWSQSSHFSLLADDETWALVSFFLANNLPAPGVFRDELVMVATDGTQRVRRLCHHHSTYNVTQDYWDSPRADLSRDGRLAVFTSNWGSATRGDVFVVRIPPIVAPPIIVPPADVKPTILNALAALLGKQPGEIKELRFVNSINANSRLDTATFDAGILTLIFK
jgi:hypothetical protein